LKCTVPDASLHCHYMSHEIHDSPFAVVMMFKSAMGMAVLSIVMGEFAMAGETRAGDPGMVKLVEAGKIAEARADWWGFDPSDSTKQLQAAIDSGARRLVIPRKTSPWIVHPLSLASNQVIVLGHPAEAEVWMLRTEKPAKYYTEDYYIDLLGVPPIFSTDKASLLVPAK